MNDRKKKIRGEPPPRDLTAGRSGTGPFSSERDIAQGTACGRNKASPEEAAFSLQQEIADWLSNVRFRRKILGGVDERNVWKKIRELNDLYEKALWAERIRYDTLMEEYRKRAEREGG